MEEIKCKVMWEKTVQRNSYYSDGCIAIRSTHLEVNEFPLYFAIQLRDFVNSEYPDKQHWIEDKKGNRVETVE